MSDLPLNIVEFIRHQDVLNDQSHSVAQLACLKSIYGLALSPREMEIYCRGTGRETYDAREHREATMVGGRQSGKTTKIAAPIALFDPELLRQLRNLREERTDRGQIDVRPTYGMKDDLAVAVALAASELTKRPSSPPPFIMPTGEPHFRPNPWTCERQAICQNFPFCMDVGVCQGFVDERLIGQSAQRS